MSSPNCAIKRASRRSTALSKWLGGDPLIEGHVLAAKSHLERARDRARTELPARVASRAVAAFAFQQVERGIDIFAELDESAILQRDFLEHPERRRQIARIHAALLGPHGVAKVFLEVRHAGFGNHLVQVRRCLGRQHSGTKGAETRKDCDQPLRFHRVSRLSCHVERYPNLNAARTPNLAAEF
jgi:hypothetical protein